MTHLLALDPGIRYPAAALFVDSVLIAASRVKLKTAWTKLPRSERCLTVARAVLDWYREQPVEQPTKLTYVFEWPKVYKHGKGDPADLFPLTGVGMAVAGLLYDRVHDLVVMDYLPRDWAGSTPKNTSGDPLDSIRGKRIWDRLSEEERSRVVLSHDSIDACGIGLKVLGRYELKHSYPGASRG